MKKVLIIVENLPVPFDRRVWQEATTLVSAGYGVSVICPKGKGHDQSYEFLDGVHIYRHPMPAEGDSVVGYALEYSCALFWQFVLTWKVFFQRGFDVIQACNPPDLIVFVALIFKLFGKKFVFDHHDINPELYEVKFGRRDFFYRLLVLFEQLTFRLANVSIATNESYKRIAVTRGGMAPDNVFVVRSGPDLDKFTLPAPQHEPTGDSSSGKVVVGYVGIMGEQDGLDGLLRVAKRIVIDAAVDNITFVLIGDGTELERLKRLSHDMGLDGAVRFTGYLRGQELLDTLGSIDIGVVPDEKNAYNDKCTMNKIMEYMALGKALVQYDLTEGRFSAGDASLYATPGDEGEFAQLVIELAHDSELRKELGCKGYERVRTALDWKFEAPKLLAAYDSALRTKVAQ